MRKLSGFPYKHVLVLGLAKSGTAAATLLLANHKHVRVNDYKAKDTDLNVKELMQQGAELILGSHPLSVLKGIDYIIKNPGISYKNPILIEAEKRNIPIVTEIELAANLAAYNPIIAITGSNGKTTTTTLVQEMLIQSNQPVQLAGNIGVVATDVAQHLLEKEALLLELSSFQLMGVTSFRPHVAALLNLFDAHLDFHGSLDNYVAAKANIFKNQTEHDFLIYNADDGRVCTVIQNAKAKLVPFSIRVRQPDGAWADEKAIYFKNIRIMEKANIALVGEHNIQNILAALSIAMMMGATKEGIQAVLATFTGVKHRLQFVKEYQGRLFYNDSKATNMLATEKALQSFKQPTILLAGGLDRGDMFTELRPYLSQVKAMILFGETKEKLQQVAHELNIQTVLVSDVKEATTVAYQYSQSGDVILLSPACASWDQYKTFEERGDMFIQAVHRLA